MKKLLACLLTFLLVISVGFTSSKAEEIDFSSMTDEDLNALKVEVESEVSNRDLDSLQAIYPGKYYIGEQLKPGEYLLKGLTSKYDYVNIDLYKYNESVGDYEYVERRSIDLGVYEFIPLLDGYYFDLLFGTATIKSVDMTWFNELTYDSNAAHIIYPGKYYVGKQIQSGDYIIKGITSKYSYVNVDFYQYDETESDYIYSERRSINLDDGEYVNLEDGCYFYLLFGTATIESVSMDWLNDLN